MNSTTPNRPYPGVNPALNFPAEHDRGPILGKGKGMVIVEAWTHRPSGVTLAVKIIKQKAGMPNEVRILKDLPLHGSIIRFDAFHRGVPEVDKDCLVLEHCGGGDLLMLRQKMWKENKAVFGEAFLWSVYHQLADALAFLHGGIPSSRPGHDLIVIHRDIKAQNILIKTLGTNSDMSSLRIKLADFDLAAFYDPAVKRADNYIGTTAMWPPEQTWEDVVATPAGDIWATGSVIHELAHGFLPIDPWKPFFEDWLRKNQLPEAWTSWSELTRTAFWCAKAPRRSLPINEDVQIPDQRRRRPCPKYSDELNGCLMAALEMDPTRRSTAGSLQRRVEEGHAGFLFEELRQENEAERGFLSEENKGEWDD